MFKRILKTLGASLAGHGIQTVTQLLLPPVFIASYGVNGYGEWLVLSAAVGYLGTLDFGLQTYVLNELTALYHRNEMERFHQVQSVGLWLMLMFTGAGIIVASGAFLLPMADLLKISGSQPAACLATFCLALQVLAGIPMGQILGVYRTFGQAHRGVMWSNLYRLMLLAVTALLAWQRAPFWIVAAGQVMVIAVVLILALASLRRNQPQVVPRLGYWSKDLARQVLKPSAFFGLFVLNNFLVYQAPVLMLQRFLGAEIVVVFSIARTMFSFVRQGIGLVQQSLAPEITRLNGLGETDKLVRLYVLFERIVLALLLVVNGGLLLSAPLLLNIWLKRPQLFNAAIFTGLMLVSIVSSLKEYKVYFQYTTNNHIKSAMITFLTYLLMLAASVPAIQWFGVRGFVGVWLATEVAQTIFLHFCNYEFFNRRSEISVQPSLRLALALSALVICAGFSRPLIESQTWLFKSVLIFSATLALAGSSYFLFCSNEMLQECKAQLTRIGARRHPQVVG